MHCLLFTSAQVTPAEAFLHLEHDVDDDVHHVHLLLCRLRRHWRRLRLQEEEGNHVPKQGGMERGHPTDEDEHFP